MTGIETADPIPVGLDSPRYAVQTLLLPGADLHAQFASAAAFGYDGVEIAVGPAFAPDDRLAEVRAASAAAGLPVAAICTHPIHDPLHPDPSEQTQRLAALTQLLEQADELGAAGVVSVPIRPSAAFPGGDSGDGFVPPKSIDLRYAADVLGAWAAALPDGRSRLFLEPLNRFEARLLNRVGQAADLARAIGHPRVVALADLFHMNIEEADLAAPIREAGPLLGHVHIADNNRLECGAGCLDFRPSFRALAEIGYTGWISLECFSADGPRVTEPAEASLARSVALLRSVWADVVAAG